MSTSLGCNIRIYSTYLKERKIHFPSLYKNYVRITFDNNICSYKCQKQWNQKKKKISETNIVKTFSKQIHA